MLEYSSLFSNHMVEKSIVIDGDNGWLCPILHNPISWLKLVASGSLLSMGSVYGTGELILLQLGSIQLVGVYNYLITLN